MSLTKFGAKYDLASYINRDGLIAAFSKMLNDIEASALDKHADVQWDSVRIETDDWDIEDMSYADSVSKRYRQKSLHISVIGVD